MVRFLASSFTCFSSSDDMRLCGLKRDDDVDDKPRANNSQASIVSHRCHYKPGYPFLGG